jgi:cyclase
MPHVRLIARLDIKGPNLIKGIRLEGLRVMGEPGLFAKKYYAEGADEIIYMDTVASLYGRNNLSGIVRETARETFIPITVGGGIRSVEDAKELLRAGADKVAVNTAAVARPELIREISNAFGSQCIVLSIEAKQKDGGGWEAYTDNGREHTGLDVIEWAKKGEELGAGECLLTSVDNEGTQKGFDIKLIKAVSKELKIPVIASGGMGTCDHLTQAVLEGGADAIAMAHVLHYKKLSLGEIRENGLKAGLDLRKFVK